MDSAWGLTEIEHSCCRGGWSKALSGTYVKNIVSARSITGGAVKGVVRVFEHVDWFFAHRQVNEACHRGSERQIRSSKSASFLPKSLLLKTNS